MKRLLSGAMVGAMLLASPPSALAAGSIDCTVTSALVLARGAAISVSFEVVCQPIGDVELSVAEYGAVDVTEPVNGVRLATGRGEYYGGEPLLCDGETANAITQIVRTENFPFKKGIALLHLHLFLADQDWTVSQYRSHDLEVRIAKERRQGSPG